MVAARGWAAGTLIEDRRDGVIESEAIADARRFGFDSRSIEAVEAVLRDRQATSFDGVFLANAPVVDAFLAGASQWRTALVAGERGFRTRFVGLDYGGLRIALDALQITVTPWLWSGVMVMETAAAAALNRD